MFTRLAVKNLTVKSLKDLLSSVDEDAVIYVGNVNSGIFKFNDKRSLIVIEPDNKVNE